MSALGLADAKSYLNISSADFDAELQTFIDAAEAALAQRVGPLTPTSVTKRVAGYGYNLHLPVYPAVSLTSVTVVGSATTLTLSDLYLENSTGAVSYNGGSFFSASAYDITYMAGRSPIPADLMAAIRELLRHMWTSQRGGGRSPNAGLDQAGMGYEFPNRVLELIAPHELLPGLA